MPISTICPSCTARLSVPDAAAGKRVKCPKCQAAVALPAADLEFEIVEPAAATPVRPAKAVRVVEDDEDDRPVRRRPRDEDGEEDEEDRPRRKPAKRKKDFLSSPPVLIVGGLIGCAIAALFVYQWQKRIERDEERQQAAAGSGSRSAPPSGPVAPAPLPAGWRVVSPPGTGVTVHSPIDLPPVNIPAHLRKKGVTFNIWQGKHNDKVYQVNVIVPDQPPGGDPDKNLDELTRGMAEGANPLGRPISQSQMRVAGRPGRQLIYSQGDKNAVIRATLVGNRAVVVSVISTQPVDPADPEVAPYLDSLRIDG